MEENKRPQFKLLDYQEQAVQKIDNIYETSRFAGAVMPTGAGKSFIAMYELLKAGGKIISEKEDGEIIIPEPDEDGAINKSEIVFVAPTNEILLQFKRNIVEYILKKNPDKMDVKEINYRVEKAFPKFKPMCYAALASDLKTNKSMLEAMSPDLVILDEAHRSGAPEFQSGVAELLGCDMESGEPEYSKEASERKKNMKVLAISATPERDTDGRNMMTVWANALSEESIDKEEDYLGIDMDISEAIDRKLIIEPEVQHNDVHILETSEYKRLVQLYQRAEIKSVKKGLRRILDEINQKVIGVKNYDELSLEEQEDLQFTKLVEQINGLIENKKINPHGKYIVFVPHNTQKKGQEKATLEQHYKKYEDKIRKLLQGTGTEIEVSCLASGLHNDKENENILQEFSKTEEKPTKLKIIIASEKLNEGVHVKGISGAFMFRNISEAENTKKRAQRILFLQQVGRCITAKKKPQDENARPMIIDCVSNFFVQNRDNPNEEASKKDLFKLTETQKEFVRLYDEALSIVPDINKVPALFRIMDILSEYGQVWKKNTIIYDKLKGGTRTTTIEQLLRKSPLLEKRDEILSRLRTEKLYFPGEQKVYDIGAELEYAKQQFWNGSPVFEDYDLMYIREHLIYNLEEDMKHHQNETSYISKDYFFRMGVPKKFRGMHVGTGTPYGPDGKDKDGFYEGQFDENGIDKDGYNRYRFNEKGIHEKTKNIHDEKGFMADGYNILTGTKLDALGYDIDGIRPVKNSEGRIIGGWDEFGFWHLPNEDGSFTDTIALSEYSEGVKPEIDVHRFTRGGYYCNSKGEVTQRKVDDRNFEKNKKCRDNDSYYNWEGIDIDGFNKDGFYALDVPEGMKGIHKITHTKYDQQGNDMLKQLKWIDSKGRTKDGKLHPHLVLTSKFIMECIKGDTSINQFAKDHKELVSEVVKAIRTSVKICRACPEFEASEGTQKVVQEIYMADPKKVKILLKICPTLKDDLKRDVVQSTKQLQDCQVKMHRGQNSRVQIQALRQQNEDLRKRIEARKKMLQILDANQEK